MGYKDFVNGTALPEADLDELSKQTLMKYATAAARNADAALSAACREGMMSYQDDINSLIVQRDATLANISTIGPVHGAWTAYSPTLTQSSSVTFTNANSTYRRIGRGVEYRWTLVVTGTGLAANLVTLSLPVNINYVSDYGPCGHFQIFDNSATQVYQGAAVPAAAGTIKGVSTYILGVGAPTFLGITNFTAALAVNDIVSGWVTYEAAADG